MERDFQSDFGAECAGSFNSETLGKLEARLQATSAALGAVTEETVETVETVKAAGNATGETATVEATAEAATIGSGQNAETSAVIENGKANAKDGESVLQILTAATVPSAEALEDRPNFGNTAQETPVETGAGGGEAGGGEAGTKEHISIASTPKAGNQGPASRSGSERGTIGDSNTERGETKEDERTLVTFEEFDIDDLMTNLSASGQRRQASESSANHSPSSYIVTPRLEAATMTPPHKSPMHASLLQTGADDATNEVGLKRESEIDVGETNVNLKGNVSVDVIAAKTPLLVGKLPQPLDAGVHKELDRRPAATTDAALLADDQKTTIYVLWRGLLHTISWPDTQDPRDVGDAVLCACDVLTNGGACLRQLIPFPFTSDPDTHTAPHPKPPTQTQVQPKDSLEKVTVSVTPATAFELGFSSKELNVVPSEVAGVKEIEQTVRLQYGRGQLFEFEDLRLLENGGLYLLEVGRVREDLAPIVGSSERRFTVKTSPLMHAEVAPAIDRMLAGSNLLKHTTYSFPHLRLFQLSRDLKRLVWYSGNKRVNQTIVDLEKITAIFVSPPPAASPEFGSSKSAPGSFQLLKTLGMRLQLKDEAELHLSCKDEDEFDHWVIGLKALAAHWQKRKLNKLELLSHCRRFRAALSHISQGKSAWIDSAVKALDEKVTDTRNLEQIARVPPLTVSETLNKQQRLTLRLKQLDLKAQDIDFYALKSPPAPSRNHRVDSAQTSTVAPAPAPASPSASKAPKNRALHRLLESDSESGGESETDSEWTGANVKSDGSGSSPPAMPMPPTAPVEAAEGADEGSGLGAGAGAGLGAGIEGEGRGESEDELAGATAFISAALSDEQMEYRKLLDLSQKNHAMLGVMEATMRALLANANRTTSACDEKTLGVITADTIAALGGGPASVEKMTERRRALKDVARDLWRVEIDLENMEDIIKRLLKSADDEEGELATALIENLKHPSLIVNKSIAQAQEAVNTFLPEAKRFGENVKHFFTDSIAGSFLAAFKSDALMNTEPRQEGGSQQGKAHQENCQRCGGDDGEGKQGVGMVVVGKQGQGSGEATTNRQGEDGSRAG